MKRYREKTVICILRISDKPGVLIKGEIGTQKPNRGEDDVKRNREKAATNNRRTELIAHPSLAALRRNQSCQTLDLELLATKTKRQSISVV